MKKTKGIIKMKRTICIVAVFIACMCCTVCHSEGMDDGIGFISGIFSPKDWDNPEFTYNRPIIPDKETALDFATFIIRRIVGLEDEQKFAPQQILYDEKDEVWIVSFWETSTDPDMAIVGGDCSIAIQKADGKVLRIWFGE